MRRKPVQPTDDLLDRDLADALHALDAPVERVSADVIIQQARARAAQRRWRFAAAAVVMLAASAAAALPGSPVRSWVESVLRGAAGADAPHTLKPDLGTPAVPTTPPDSRGVAIFIADSAEVAFTGSQDTGEVVIRFIDAAELRIRSADSLAGYQVRRSGILINNVGSHASHVVDVSDRASYVRVLANGRTIFERRGRQVVVGPSPRGDGSYVVTLRPSPAR